MSKKTLGIGKIMGTLTRGSNPPGSASGSSILGNMKRSHRSHMGSQTSLASGTFSRKSGTLGLNDSDYFNGHDPTFLQRASLYIFGDRSQMKNVRLESFPKVEFIPIGKGNKKYFF